MNMHQEKAFDDLQFWLVIILLIGSVGMVALFSALLGSTGDYIPHGFSAASRSLNSILGAVITSIALVITLTSNLYTPRLVQLFLTHPVILLGLCIMLTAHMMLSTSMFFNESSPIYEPLLWFCIALGYIAYAFILPFLYIVSQFLRPTYFLPRLTARALGKINNITITKKLEADNRQIFSHVNVITNIAFTGMRRGDRQLALLTVNCLYEILTTFIKLDKQGSQKWRTHEPLFSSSLAREGREFLRNTEIWPEAYILGQLVQILEQADGKQNELLSATSELLVKSLKLAMKQHSDSLVELHILVFNALMRLSLQDKDLRKFQNLSYQYRQLIEVTSDNPRWMNEIARHLLHYAKIAARTKLFFGIDTVLYDLGEIVLSLALHDEYTALTFLHIYAGPTWHKAAQGGGPEANSAWRSMIRVFWEARAREYVLLSETLQAEFLEDIQHRRHLKKILEDNRPLHWEYNDRLLRFAYLSPKAEQQATSFSNEGF